MTWPKQEEVQGRSGNGSLSFNGFDLFLPGSEYVSPARMQLAFTCSKVLQTCSYGIFLLNQFGRCYIFLHAEEILARRHGNGSTDESV